MQTYMKSQRSASIKWFILAALLGGLFVAYVAVYATGSMNLYALGVERWLLNRPIGRIDCTFYEWRNIGEAPTMAVLALILGAIFWRAGYGWRALVIVLVLLGVGVGIEVLGKKAFALPLPPTLRSGMTVLTCPQMHGQPLSVQLQSAALIWPNIPDPPHVQVSWARDVAKMPFIFQTGYTENSFPGGHALRWCFTGLVTAWMCWTLLRRRAVLRVVLTIIFFLAALLGGFMQFWVGVHFITDTISGYLLGTALACAAIALLVLIGNKKNISTLATLPMRSVPGNPPREAFPTAPAGYPASMPGWNGVPTTPPSYLQQPPQNMPGWNGPGADAQPSQPPYPQQPPQNMPGTRNW